MSSNGVDSEKLLSINSMARQSSSGTASVVSVNGDEHVPPSLQFPAPSFLPKSPLSQATQNVADALSASDSPLPNVATVASSNHHSPSDDIVVSNPSSSIHHSPSADIVLNHSSNHHSPSDLSPLPASNHSLRRRSSSRDIPPACQELRRDLRSNIEPRGNLHQPYHIGWLVLLLLASVVLCVSPGWMLQTSASAGLQSAVSSICSTFGGILLSIVGPEVTQQLQQLRSRRKE